MPGGLAFQGLHRLHQFPTQLHEGQNVIKVVFDANKQVSEGDEKNAFSIRVQLKIDCDGDGKVGVDGFKAPDKQPQPGTALELKSATP